MIDWKESARHFRLGRYLAEQQEIKLKQKLRSEQQQRSALVATLSDILMDIAYDDDDTSQEWCNVCHRSLIEENGHAPGCLYVLALTTLVEASRHGD